MFPSHLAQDICLTSPKSAIAEDLRRAGLLLFIAGFIRGFIEEELSPELALLMVLYGILAMGLGYWFHRTESARDSVRGE